jgi:microcystin-dependent protein
MPVVSRYLGQIVATGGTWSKPEMAACDGALLSINQNQGLFGLIGTRFGGDGQSLFALPDLRGAAVAGAGESVDPAYKPKPYDVGHRAGVEAVRLDGDTTAGHSHTLFGASTAGNQNTITGALYGAASTPGGSTPFLFYGPPDANMNWLNGDTLATVGAKTPAGHANVQPFGVICFGICIQGALPQRG